MNSNPNSDDHQIIADLRYSVLKSQFENIEPEHYPDNQEEVFDYDVHPVTIQDGRHSTETCSIEMNGFELIQLCAHELDTGQISRENRNTYAHRISNFLYERMGSTKETAMVVVLNTVQRGTGKSKPLFRVHNDFCDRFAWRRARQILSDKVDWHPQCRFDFIQTWRPLYRPLTQFPLALADSRTVNKDELMEHGPRYNIKFSPAHRWTYFSTMKQDEILVFRTFCSDLSDPSRYTPHTSFVHPDFPQNNANRTSIETRAVVLYK